MALPYFYHFDGDGNTVALSNPSAGVVNTYRYDAQGRLISTKEGVENLFRARGEAGWMDEGNGLLSPARSSSSPNCASLCQPAYDPSPPVPDLQPQLSGAGACFLEGVPNCLAATGRRTR